MQVTVRLFAGHRERVGASRLELELPDDASVSDAFAALARRYPALNEMDSFTTFARNREVVPRETALTDGDEVALLQPVSGGRGYNHD